MSHKRVSLLSQPGLEVVIPTTPEPPPKILVQGPAVPEKDCCPSSISPLLARGRNRPNLQIPKSAWSDSPVSEYGSLFPRSAYYRQSYWPATRGPAGTAAAAAQDDSTNRWPSSNGRYSRAERRTFAFLGRRKFWLILTPIFLLLAISLAVGLGVGLGFESIGGTSSGTSSNQRQTPSEPSDGTAGGSADVAAESMSPAAARPTSTAASPTESVLVLAPTPITCPQANGTAYQASGSEPAFLVLCDTTYRGVGASSSSSATSSSTKSKDTESVEECIDVCGEDSSCAGASWGKAQGKFTCWMEESLLEGNGTREEPEWFFVVKQARRKQELY
ncbi:hypothetical protein SLS62_009450 [Diatrype stigma]|uniref:Apple domain-containing protein n=1 Tax=Diatrype stigma TaxID=117547 RepID=A0AAN9UDI1_9PEZI